VSADTVPAPLHLRQIAERRAFQRLEALGQHAGELTAQLLEIRQEEARAYQEWRACFHDLYPTPEAADD
jgi:hypothetical protein